MKTRWVQSKKVFTAKWNEFSPGIRLKTKKQKKTRSKGAFRLDAKQREAKVGDLREWSITSLAKVANLRERLLIFATGRFIG